MRFKYCKRCNAELERGLRYCTQCGASHFRIEPEPVVAAPEPVEEVPDKSIKARLLRLFRKIKELPKKRNKNKVKPVKSVNPEPPANYVGSQVYDGDSPTIIYQTDNEVMVPEDSTAFMEEDNAFMLLRKRTRDTYRLDAPVVLGKGKDSSYRISDNSAISRKHARISKADDFYYIEDLGSTNNTYLNGIKIEYGISAPIASGDEFALADEEFVFLLQDNYSYDEQVI